MLWAGYNHATAAGTTDVAYADASISVVTGMARARIWPLERHSVVFDTGLGFTSYSMSASGHGIIGCLLSRPQFLVNCCAWSIKKI